MVGTCDVSIGSYDGDPAEVFHQSIVTARKPHKCNECGAMIESRQRYERTSGKWDGSWDVFRVCLPCSEIGSEFSDGGRTFGVLWEDLQVNWDEGANLQACLNRLSSVAAKERMRAQWMHWKGIE